MRYKTSGPEGEELRDALPPAELLGPLLPGRGFAAPIFYYMISDWISNIITYTNTIKHIVILYYIPRLRRGCAGESPRDVCTSASRQGNQLYTYVCSNRHGLWLGPATKRLIVHTCNEIMK